VDRDAIAREQRRRHAAEALEFERQREAELTDQIDVIVTEREGPRIDEETFARMAPEDVETVRSLLSPDGAPELDEEDWLRFEDDADDEEPAEAEDDFLEEEIGRLQGEVAESRRRQKALQRYLDALGS
jgi:hypothetical protein